MSKIYLYAEVLTNIRQVTLYASLQTAKTDETRIDISSDRRTITVIHDGETASLFLPTGVAGSAEVTLPPKRVKDISVRFEIAHLEESASIPNLKRGIESPWSAKRLSKDTVLLCKACQSPVLHSGKVLVWKDLPSDNWAEMMDFWHCHKPHDEPTTTHEGEAAAAKGYGLLSKVTAISGTGLVDIQSFLLDAHDCVGVEQSSTFGDNESALQCIACKAQVGSRDFHAGGWRLYKWSLSVQKAREGVQESFPAEVFICAQLLNLVEMQGTRRFVLHTGNKDDNEIGLLAWVFNPDLQYSNSQKLKPINRAMKVFYKQVDNPQRLLDDHNTSLEELTLPPSILQDFQRALELSTGLLPLAARSFQDWKVGLVDRFVEDSVEQQEQMAETWRLLQKTVVRNPTEAGKQLAQQEETLKLIELSEEALYG